MNSRLRSLVLAASASIAFTGLVASAPAQADVPADPADRATVKTVAEPYITTTKKRVLLVANVYAEADIALHGTVRFTVKRKTTGKTVYSNNVDVSTANSELPIAQVIDVVSKKNFKPNVWYVAYMTYDARFGHLEKDAPRITKQFKFSN